MYKQLLMPSERKIHPFVSFNYSPDSLRKKKRNFNRQAMQLMRLGLFYSSNGKTVDSGFSIESYELTVKKLLELSQDPQLIPSSKREIETAITLGETLENRPEINQTAIYGKIPGVNYEPYAAREVTGYGKQEDLFVKPDMPAFEDTIVDKKDGMIFFPKTEIKATGKYKYGIRFSTGELHLVPDQGNYRHSSTVNSEAVLSAGNLTINSSGLIEYIDNNSGHYAPPENYFINGMRHLFNNGFLIRGKVRFGLKDTSDLRVLNTLESTALLLKDAPIEKISMGTKDDAIEID